jgi:hypothetical protein
MADNTVQFNISIGGDAVGSIEQIDNAFSGLKLA